MYSTKYYWQIVAWDNHNESSTGPQWEFTTEAKLNNPPYAPHDETPTNTSINVPLTALLSWVGGDPDAGDLVTYDVYFGTSSAPSKAMSNQSNTSYDPGNFGYNTTYYWRIVAWDNTNASTVGDLWHFTTKQNSTLKKAFIFGRNTHLTEESGYITIEAVNLRLIFFKPFQRLHYIDGEEVTFLKDTAKVIDLPGFIIGIVDVVT